MYTYMNSQVSQLSIACIQKHNYTRKLSKYIAIKTVKAFTLEGCAKYSMSIKSNCRLVTILQAVSCSGCTSEENDSIKVCVVVTVATYYQYKIKTICNMLYNNTIK